VSSQSTNKIELAVGKDIDKDLAQGSSMKQTWLLMMEAKEEWRKRTERELAATAAFEPRM
jgi:hypothetical protein